MQYHFSYKIIFFFFISFLILLLLLTYLLDPISVGLYGILAVLIVIYLLSWTFLYASASIWIRLRRVRGEQGNYKRIFYLTAILALVPILLIALNSLSSMWVIEIILIATLEAVALFFAIKQT